MEVSHNGKKYLLSNRNAVDLSIQNTFSNKLPTFFNSSRPSCEPLLLGDFIGDLEQGGSCNVPIVSLNIHCTGTHTECEAHVNNSNVKIVDVCPLGFIPTSLITISPEHYNMTRESYHTTLSKDMVITRSAIEKKLPTANRALIIRTKPNDYSKKSRN